MPIPKLSPFAAATLCVALSGFCAFAPVAASAQIADSTMRRVALQGGSNFRDLGGYATADGRHVKWNAIYRSADMSRLTDADLAVLEQRHIHCDVDLRGHQESAKAPDRLNPNTDYILCPAGSDSLADFFRSVRALHGNAGDSLSVLFYANTTYLTARYKPLFQKLLALPDTDALVFHCTAGKDRTGMAAALVLYALGVPYETIRADYEATNYYWSARERMLDQWVASMHIDRQVAADMLAAKGAYIDAMFDALTKQYGSVDAYLRTQLGLDDAALKQLRARYLE